VEPPSWCCDIRIITNYRAEADKQSVDMLIDRLLESVK
jgi:hypothetical protein